METKTFTLQMQENAEYIFERYKGLIYKIARDILDDSLLAEDCLQEVVLKLTLLPGKLNTDEYVICTQNSGHIGIVFKLNTWMFAYIA